MNIFLDIPYATSPVHPQQKLDLYLNLNSNSTSQHPPLIIYIHGGLWVDRDKKDYQNIGKTLSEKGYAVAIINYRLSPKILNSNNELSHPKHTQDCAEAIDFLIINAGHQPFLYDPTNIFLIGHSVGAHMIGLLCTGKYLKDVDRFINSVKGFVGIQGIYDLKQYIKDFPSFLEEISYSQGTDTTKWESPQFLSSIIKKCPWLLIHSLDDDWVLVNQTENYANHLKQLYSKLVNETQKSLVLVITSDVHGKHNEIIENIGISGKDEVTGYLHSFIQTVINK